MACGREVDLSVLLKSPVSGGVPDCGIMVASDPPIQTRPKEQSAHLHSRIDGSCRPNMTFKPHHDPTHLYFITATVLGWRRLFAKSTYAHIVLGSLDWHRRQGRWALYAFVLMPDHLHAIIKPRNERTISDVLQSFGSFTTHSILAQLRAEGRSGLLTFFRQRQDCDVRKKHQIWQPIQAKNVHSRAFLREKLEYIHENPVAKRWHLAGEWADYPYSSACYYDKGVAAAVEVDDVREWL
jgi:REP element-mobilizing transposase RayT